MGSVLSGLDVHSRLKWHSHTPIQELCTKAQVDRSPRRDRRNQLNQSDSPAHKPLGTPTIRAIEKNLFALDMTFDRLFGAR